MSDALLGLLYVNCNLGKISSSPVCNSSCLHWSLPSRCQMYLYALFAAIDYIALLIINIDIFVMQRTPILFERILCFPLQTNRTIGIHCCLYFNLILLRVPQWRLLLYYSKYDFTLIISYSPLPLRA